MLRNRIISAHNQARTWESPTSCVLLVVWLFAVIATLLQPLGITTSASDVSAQTDYTLHRTFASTCTPQFMLCEMSEDDDCTEDGDISHDTNSDCSFRFNPTATHASTFVLHTPATFPLNRTVPLFILNHSWKFHTA
ncbi:MAG: hypothetical protein JNL32_10360 [Candidatus Kapabacteria bacterium]|nr:hypothetical protein [Candidatus Kapabacteria bacterium]